MLSCIAAFIYLLKLPFTNDTMNNILHNITSNNSSIDHSDEKNNDMTISSLSSTDTTTTTLINDKQQQPVPLDQLELLSDIDITDSNAIDHPPKSNLVVVKQKKDISMALKQGTVN